MGRHTRTPARALVTPCLSVARLQTPATPHLDNHVFNAQQRPSPPESLPNGRVVYPSQYGLRVDPGSDYMVSDRSVHESISLCLAEIVSDFRWGGSELLEKAIS